MIAASDGHGGSSTVGPGWSRKPGTPRSRRGRILVVEDEDVLRDAMGPLLEAQGHQVAFAENGRAALAWLKTQPVPDLIVLDLRMPVMDGWEFRRHQQGDSRLADIPVVVLSAFDHARTAEVRASAVLRKPLDFDQLLQLVRQYCPLPS